MELKLSENIKKFRRERSLTQEQLAEVLGVTTGAVYKWEAKLSLPEIGLITDMADLFDTSVDVLLGYEMKDNRLEACVERLRKYRHEKDPEGPAEAEKALKKYPHIFRVVYESAAVYGFYGFENHDEKALRRAIELLENYLLLIAQNDDPDVSETDIYGEIAGGYIALDEYEKAIEILKKHNDGGVFNDMIGQALSYSADGADEAPYYLSLALANSISSLTRTVSGFLNVYEKRNDSASGLALLQWFTSFLSGLSEDGRPSFTSKVNAAFTASMAYAQLKTGDRSGAQETLRKAKDMAEEFDASPDYSLGAVRFTERVEKLVASDDIGKSATEALENTVIETGDRDFKELWEEL